MKAPQIPADEALRLASVRSLDLFDTDAERRFDEIVELAASVCGVTMAGIALVEEERQWFKSIRGLELSETPRETSICGHTIFERDLLEVSDASRDERFHDNPLVVEDPQIRFYAGVPLLVDTYAVGTLCVFDTEPRSLNPDQRRALEILAHQAAIQMTVARTIRSATDPLTGLATRGVAHEWLTSQARDATRVAMFLDLDHFKLANDAHGHAAGDQILAIVGGRLLSGVRENDIVARMGGDEFVVLMTNIDVSLVTELKDRLRHLIESPIHVGQAMVQLGVSIGIAAAEPGTHTTDLIARADEAMFKDKAARHSS